MSIEGFPLKVDVWMLIQVASFWGYGQSGLSLFLYLWALYKNAEVWGLHPEVSNSNFKELTSQVE